MNRLIFEKWRIVTKDFLRIKKNESKCNLCGVELREGVTFMPIVKEVMAQVTS